MATRARARKHRYPRLEHVDVLIVGAGLSGIGAACHLRSRSPGKSFAILEARDAIGGTWDLFRYPGIRSDSDMFTLGYGFRPWQEAKAIADGPVDPHVHPRHRARQRRRAAHPLPPPRRARRLVERRRSLDGGGGADRHAARRFVSRADFLFGCTGYYRYDEGYTPQFEGTRALRRRDRPPAALARGPRLHRQARGGHRQRRNRGDARARDGRARRARDDAPALTELRGVAAGQRSDRRLPAPRLPAKVAYPIVRWKNVAAHHPLLPRSAGAGRSS